MAEQKPQTSKSAAAMRADDREELSTGMKKLEVGDSSRKIATGSVGKKNQKKGIASLSKIIVHNILNYLDIPDLISVAQSNKFLKSCADSFILDNYERFSADFRVSSVNDEFFLQFGHIGELLDLDCSEVEKSDWSDKNFHVLTVVADKCQKYVKYLKLKNIFENLTNLTKTDRENICNLFGNIKKMKFTDCRLDGWGQLMRSRKTKIELLSLEFRTTDALQEYIRKYQGLKTIFISGLFPMELLELNSTITTLAIHVESLSKNNLRNLSRLSNLKNLYIDISGPRRTCCNITVDFTALAKIPNLHYLYLVTSVFNTLKTPAYIATLLALQHHQKLSEFHFLCQHSGPIENLDPKQFQANAFPNLKQLSMYSTFPYLTAVPWFQRLQDIFIMETSTMLLRDYEIFRTIIVEMPRVQRIIFDLSTEINEACLKVLRRICQARASSKPKLMVLAHKYDNNIVKASSLQNNVVIIYSVYQPTACRRPFVFESSHQSAFDRATLVADKEECVAINYVDFCTGINTVDALQPF